MSVASEARLRTAIDGEYPTKPVAIARAIVGATAAVRSIVAWGALRDIAVEDHLDAPWAGWLPAPSEVTIGVTVGAWFFTSVLFAAGMRTRLTGAALTVAIVATVALDQQIYSNHVYLMAILVALIAIASPAHGRAPAWPVLVLKLQITVVYVFAALTKVNNDWLSGDILRRVIGTGLVEVPEALLRGPWLAILVVVSELAIAVGLWFVATRPFALAMGVGMHIAIPLTMLGTVQLMVFSSLMLASYFLFVAHPFSHRSA